MGRAPAVGGDGGPRRARTAQGAAFLARACLLAAATAAAACGRSQGGGADPAPEGPPGPRRAIAGLAGFRSRSRVEWAVPGSRPHVLVTTYAFPARAHWRLQPLEGGSGDRRLLYRSGAALYEVHPREWSSRPLEGPERTRTLLSMELRRAVTIWPDGVAWEPAADVRRAVLEGLGTLEAASFDAAGRPSTVRARDPQGAVVEALEGIEWSAEDRWPAGWRLVGPAGPVWTERIEALNPLTGVLERYFLPPDRAPAGSGPRFDPAAFREVRLEARIVRREPLPAGSDWEDARRAAEALAARLAPTLPAGSRIDPAPAVEVDAAGAPIALLARMRRPGDAAAAVPAGWAALPAGRAVGLWLDDPRRVEPGLLEGMAAAAPADRASGPPYVQFQATGGGPPARLVLPLQEPR